MNTVNPLPSSIFSKIIDKLQNKSEEELRHLYLKFFSNELSEEWKEITKEADFRNASDEEIILAVHKQRYSN